MSKELEFNSEVRRLLDQFVDGTISDEGLSQLEHALRDRPETVDGFLDYCQLHIDLAIDLRADRALEAFCDRQQHVGSPLASTPMAPLPLTENEAGLFGAPPAGQPLFGFSRFFALGIAACATMLISVAALWWWIERRTVEDRTPLDIAAVRQTPEITSVQINSGSSKLELAGIGTVVVEGPADFTLTGPKRARLNKGRIRVHVAQKSGQGFVVETPDGEVTDLGTEFGIAVAEQQPGTGLVVFQGAVDLRLGDDVSPEDNSRVEHLFGGDGVRFSKVGQLNRIMSIVTEADGMFRMDSDQAVDSSAVITRVTDNIHTDDTRKFYEIVRGGMREDALAYVDRQHEWNGLTKKGMPMYLIGADYVKPFNSDRGRKDLGIEVTLNCPARLFVILDDRIQPPPAWLEERDFYRIGDKIGLDMGTSFAPDGTKITGGTSDVGPGVSVEFKYSIWRREVTTAGRVKLGPIGPDSKNLSMYGIAAVRLEPEKVSEGK